MTIKRRLLQLERHIEQQDQEERKIDRVYLLQDLEEKNGQLESVRIKRIGKQGVIGLKGYRAEIEALGGKGEGFILTLEEFKGISQKEMETIIETDEATREKLNKLWKYREELKLN
jgi:hypothetical protein